MKLVITKRDMGWSYAPYKWEILNENGNQYNCGFTWTMWGAKLAAYKAMKPRRRKPSRVVFEKELPE